MGRSEFRLLITGVWICVEAQLPRCLQDKLQRAGCRAQNRKHDGLSCHILQCERIGYRSGACGSRSRRSPPSGRPAVQRLDASGSGQLPAAPTVSTARSSGAQPPRLPR